MDPQDETAIGAIETIYNFPDDQVLFQWPDTSFSAFLSGDISDSWRDIKQLLSDLESGRKEVNIQFPSQTFWHYWQLREWEEEQWKVTALYGQDSQRKMTVKKDVFCAEFKKLVARVEADLQAQGYDLNALSEYKSLQE
ncbi:MAG: hypothetical protein AAFV95_16475 [Bacteroidota bacterium]